jgi:hypothetical protein
MSRHIQVKKERERALRERRELKQEKKRAARALKREAESGPAAPGPDAVPADDGADP